MPVYNPQSAINIGMSGTAGGPNHDNIKIFTTVITPTTGNGFAIDISEAGFTQVTNINVQSINNTASLLNIPVVAIKSYTTTQVVVNIVVSNSQVVSLLGATVTGLVFATNLAGLQLHIRAEGF